KQLPPRDPPSPRRTGRCVPARSPSWAPWPTPPRLRSWRPCSVDPRTRCCATSPCASWARCRPRPPPRGSARRSPTATRARAILLRTLGRRADNATLRELAAALLGEMADTGAAPEMAAAVGRVSVESQADIALEGVATAGVRALARLGGPHAVAAAVTMTRD